MYASNSGIPNIIRGALGGNKSNLNKVRAFMTLLALVRPCQPHQDVTRTS